jgi:hypothetical protein
LTLSYGVQNAITSGRSGWTARTAVDNWCFVKQHNDSEYFNDFKGTLDWTTSSDTVFIKDNDFLYIGTGGIGYSDWVEREFSIDLDPINPIIIEQRIKLESGGLCYRLPGETIYFDDSSEIMVTYLPSQGGGPYGWHFDQWTGVEYPEVPGTGFWTTATADYWVITRIVLNSNGGKLYMKPDDREKGWLADDFILIYSADWTHSKITKVRFSQPWDSVNYIDYIRIFREVTLFEEDFESDPVDSWPTGWIKDANATAPGNGIVADPNFLPSQALRLYGSVGSCWGALAYHPCDFPAEFYVECDIYTGSEVLSGCHLNRADLSMRNGSNWWNPSRRLMLFKGNGDILGTDNTVLGTYNTERWYHVKVHYKRVGANLSLSYWINGSPVGQRNVTIDNLPTEESLDHIELTAPEGSVLFDNLKVYIVGS